MIKKMPHGYQLRTADGRRVLGNHATRKEAVAQEAAIKASEAGRKKGKK